MPKMSLPNGEEIDVPDDITPELGQRLRAYHDSLLNSKSVEGEVLPKDNIDFDSILGKAKIVGREGLAIADSAVKGALAIPKTIVDAGATISELGDKHLPDSLKVPGATQTLKKISGFLTPIPTKTSIGKNLANVAASTAGALVSPGNAATNAIIGASGGAGAETAAAVLGDNPITRIAGGLIGGGLAGLKTSTKGNEAALAQEAIEKLPTEQLNRAIKTMEDAKKQGIPLNLSQALDTPSNVDAYVNTLAQSQFGKETAKVLREQPQRVQEETRRRIGAMPGIVEDSLTSANNLKQAASDRIKQVGGERSEVWKQTLEKSKLQHPQEVTGDEIVSALNSLKQSQSKYTSRSAEYKLLQDLHDRLFNDGKVLRDPEQIYQTIRSFKGDLTPSNLASASVNKDAAKYVKGIANNLTDNMKAMQPYRDADQAYQQFSNVIVNPLKKSIVGTIAGKKGAQVDQSANVNQIEGVFKRGTQLGGNSQILKLADELKLAGKGDDFANSAKSYLANRADEAFRSMDNRVNEASALNLKKALGSDNQLDNIARGTNDILIGQARVKGIKDEEAYAAGFKKFMNVVSRAANRPSSISGATFNDITDKAGDHLLKRTGQFSIITPLRQPILWWSEKLKADSLGTMDKLLNSPEGVRMLITLGKQPRMSHKAQTAISTFLSINANIQNSNVNNTQE